jgi:hypothetical protein
MTMLQIQATIPDRRRLTRKFTPWETSTADLGTQQSFTMMHIKPSKQQQDFEFLGRLLEHDSDIIAIPGCDANLFDTFLAPCMMKFGYQKGVILINNAS